MHLLRVATNATPSCDERDAELLPAEYVYAWWGRWGGANIHRSVDVYFDQAGQIGAAGPHERCWLARWPTYCRVRKTLTPTLVGNESGGDAFGSVLHVAVVEREQVREVNLDGRREVAQILQRGVSLAALDAAQVCHM